MAGTKIKEDELEDSEEEGEELLKQVKDRKQSIAKLNMSPQEKDLMKRLSTAGEGKLKSFIIWNLNCNKNNGLKFFISIKFFNITFYEVTEKIPSHPTPLQEEPAFKNDIPSTK